METIETNENVAMLIIIALTIIVFMCIIDAILSIKNRLGKKSKYFMQDEVNITSPLQIGYIVNDELSYKHIISVVLHFLHLKYITLRKIINEDESVTYELYKKDLEIFDEDIYSSLENIDKNEMKYFQKYKVSISDIYAINRIVFNDSEKIDVNEIEKFYNNKECKKLETKELKEKKDYLTKILDKELILYKILNKKGNELTSFGEKIRNKWMKFKLKTKIDITLSAKGLKKASLMGKELAYGVSLGLCKIPLKDVSKIGKK